ncbi:MAG: hypothetical protein AABZ06_05155, partial [Bdellovibrionota bacterium]
LGAWGGPRYVLEVAVLGVMLGGLLAICKLIAKRRVLDFSRKLYRFLLSLFIKELEIETPKIDRGFTMPFGVALAVAAVWTVFDVPLKRMGLWW